MSELQDARRRAITAGVAILAVLVVGLLLVVKLWPDSGSPSRDEVKGPDITWSAAADGVNLPISRAAGPARFMDGRGVGFGRSELGAALAAIHISHNASAGPGPAIFTAAIRSQVTGPDRDPMLDHIAKEYEADRQKFGLAEGAPIPPAGAGRIAYKVTRYTDTEAAVTVASTLAANATRFFAFDLEVRWIDGDWQMVAPPAGSFANVFKELSEPPAGSVILEAPH
jgi:hypothetical protein